jgi:glycosyltransferase involved in cell wall biosynthesis
MMGSELLSSPSSIKESSSKASTQPAANSSEQGYTHPRIAALIPCYNEELTVGKVIDDFHKYLPEATVYVYDNNSSDNTAEIARQHKAIVRFESRQGKGNVVRQMLRDIDADYYIMVDGDDTYPIEQANELLAPLFVNEADHVIGDRLSNGAYHKENKRAFHDFGNSFVRYLIKKLYHYEYADVMTGYRAFNRTFAKSLPILSPGFEIETELSIQAADKRWRIAQIPINYRDRPAGSFSKLNTFSDGLKVLGMIFTLFKDYKPLGFFSILAFISLVIGLILGIPVIMEFNNTGVVRRFPTAILAVAFCGLAFLLLCSGLILDTVVKGSRRQWELNALREYESKKTQTINNYL